MKTLKNYMKWEGEDMRSYLDQTRSYSLDDAPKIRVGSSKLKWTMLGKNFKWYGIFKFFTIYRNVSPTFYSF